jgi:hypothetical protein
MNRYIFKKAPSMVSYEVRLWLPDQVEEPEFHFSDETRSIPLFGRNVERCHCGVFPALLKEASLQPDRDSLYPARMRYKVQCGRESCREETQWMDNSKDAIALWQLVRKLAKP